jgi:hypothetical protein
VFVEFAFIPITLPDHSAGLIPIPEAALIEALRTVAPIDCVSAIAAVYGVDDIRLIADELIELWEHLKN